MENTITARTAWCYTNMPEALSPLILHLQCKCQHSEKCIECLSIIIKIVLASQIPLKVLGDVQSPWTRLAEPLDKGILHSKIYFIHSFTHLKTFIKYLLCCRPPYTLVIFSPIQPALQIKLRSWN